MALAQRRRPGRLHLQDGRTRRSGSALACGAGPGAVWSAGNEILATVAARPLAANRHADRDRRRPWRFPIWSRGRVAGDRQRAVRSLGRRSGTLAPLPGPGGGSVNAAVDGRVVARQHVIGVAARRQALGGVDRAAGGMTPRPPALWVRGHDGVSWGRPRPCRPGRRRPGRPAAGRARGRRGRRLARGETGAGLCWPALSTR